MQRHKRVYARLRRAWPLREALLRRTGSRTDRRSFVTAGAERYRSASSSDAALRPGARSLDDAADKKIFAFLIPVPQNLAYPARVLSNEGALLEASLKRDRARAGRTGAPRNGRCGPGGCASEHRLGRRWVTVRAHSGRCLRCAGPRQVRDAGNPTCDGEPARHAWRLDTAPSPSQAGAARDVANLGCFAPRERGKVRVRRSSRRGETLTPNSRDGARTRSRGCLKFESEI